MGPVHVHSVRYKARISSSLFHAVHPNTTQIPLAMTSLPLAGKVAIVTGSSRGIGAAIAARLASDGANVVVNYVNGAKHAEDVVNSINSLRPSAVAIKADAASVKDMQALLDQTLSTFGRVDILVLNAGIAGTRALSEIDETYYASHFDANVKGPLFLVKAAAPYLEAGSCMYL